MCCELALAGFTTVVRLVCWQRGTLPAAKAAHEKKQATAAREKKEVTAAAKDTVAATRQAAFLKALSQQADAEFQSMPQSV